MADTTILVLNAGSSSLKFSLFLEQDETLQLVLVGDALAVSPQQPGIPSEPKLEKKP